MPRRHLAVPLTLLLAFLLVGCGGGDGGGDDGPQERTFTVQLTEGGTRTISGRITLPEGTTAGHMIQFNVDRRTTPAYFSTEGLGTNNEVSSFVFRIVNATDGDYRLSSRVDLDDSGQVGSGDLEGYYAGTLAAPVQDRDLATLITVAGADVEGIDFGLGPLP